MFESGFQVGRIAGISIRIHYTWLVIFFLINVSLFYVFKLQLDRWNDLGAAVTALATSILFFISIILHELGHSIVALRSGIPVKSITLFIFGGVAQSEQEADTPGEEFRIAIAGPLVSLALAACFLVLRDWIGGKASTPLYVSLDWLATINFIIAVFNMIPGFPLDGGRVLRSVVWGVTGDETRGMRLAVAGGRFVAYGLMVIGVWIAFQTGNVLSAIWLIGIGWFLLSAAEASMQAYAQERLFRRVGIDSLLDDEVPRVAGDISVADWVTGFVLPRLRRAALVEQGGRVTGIVSLSDASRIAEPEWQRYRVEQIMTPYDQIHSVSINGSAEDVLKIMQMHSINQVPVMDGDEVIGWIDRENLLRAIAVYSESKQQ